MAHYASRPIPQSSSMFSNGQTPSSAGSPDRPAQRSRANSFNFMRRTRSSEPSSAGSGEPNIIRKMSFSKQEAARVRRELSKQQPLPPRIPSQILPVVDYSSFAPEAYNHYNYATQTYSPSLSSPQATLFPTRTVEPVEMPVQIVHVERSGNVVPIIAAPKPPVPKQHDTTSHQAAEVALKSITNRGRFSYNSVQAGDVNGARRIRRRKDPSAFNILVVGSKSAGKTSFIEFLRTSLSQSAKQRTQNSPRQPAAVIDAQRGSFVPHYVETDIDGERVGVTIYDSKGLERHVVDLQLREMTSFVESKFQETFSEEQKVVRTPGVQDTHIHCVILLLDPSRLDSTMAMSKAKTHEVDDMSNTKALSTSCLDEHLDIDVFRALHNKATVIPLISKADTVTTGHMAHLKRSVAESVKCLTTNGTNPYAGLSLDDDADSDTESVEQPSVEHEANDESSATSSEINGTNVGLDPAVADVITKTDKDKLISTVNTLSPFKAQDLPETPTATCLPLLPMSIMSPDTYESGLVGRRFPWGLADPNNPGHCDFVLLKDSLFWEWKDDLRVASRERWYEGWRTSRLRRTNTMMPIYSTKNGVNGARTASGAHSHLSNDSPGHRVPSDPDEAQHVTVSSAEVSAFSSPALS